MPSKDELQLIAEAYEKVISENTDIKDWFRLAEGHYPIDNITKADHAALGILHFIRKVCVNPDVVGRVIKTLNKYHKQG